MKLRAIVAGTALATTGLVGVAAGTASAGCGITLELHNRGSSTVSVDLANSDVKIDGMVFSAWKRIGTGTVSVGPGATERANFNADFGCDWARMYRIDVNRGASSWYANTTSVYPTVHVHVD
jgi:hypothetical protein